VGDVGVGGGWVADNGGGHAGERAMAGGNGVGCALHQAESIGGVGFRGEVVHLVVEEEAEGVYGDSRAEAEVEGVGAGDGVAVGVDDGEVGRLVIFFLGMEDGGGGGQVADGAGEGGGGSWLGGVDGLAPGVGVGGCSHVGEREVGEVGVAEVVGAIHVGPAEGFGEDVDLFRGAVGAERGEVIAAEDVEDFDEDDAAGAGRGRGEDLVAVVAAGEGGALLDFVMGEVLGGDEAMVGGFEGGDLGG